MKISFKTFTIIGILLAAEILLSGYLVPYPPPYQLRSSIPCHQTTWEAIKENPAIVQRLGEPIRSCWWIFEYQGPDHIFLFFLVSGSKTNGKVEVIAHECEDSWVYAKREILIEGDTDLTSIDPP